MADYDLGTARGKIEIDATDAVRGVDDAARAQGRLTQSTGVSSTALIGSGVALAGVGIAAVGAFGVAVNAAANFEQGLSGIKAVSGATEKDMDSLRKKALQLGADTSFSAGEAASAMEELVKAGLSVDDVLNGAADATVSLAAAGGVALPEAAAIASTAMNQFSLDASELPHIADLIAGAANASAIDVSDFGMSMAQAGATANLVGLSFDDMALAITAMGNAGIKGSDAGTSLKTFLANLQPTTEKQINLFTDLGLITTDTTKAVAFLGENGFKPLSGSMDHVRQAASDYLEKTQGIPDDSAEMGRAVDSLLQKQGDLGNAFFDSSGKIKSMSEIAGVLGGALEGMTEQQKAATLETLFGSDAIRAAAIIAGEGSAGMDKLAESMTKVSAADVAATRLDNMKGSMEALKGSFETLLIVAGTPFLNALRGIVDAVTGVVNWLSNLDPKILEVGMKVLAAGGAFAIFAGGILTAVGMIKRFKETLDALQMASMLTNPVVLAVAAVAALAAGLVYAYQNSETFRQIVDETFADIKPIIEAVTDAVQAFIYTLTSGFTEDEGTPIESYALAVRGLAQTINDYVLPAIRFFVDAVGGLDTILAVIGVTMAVMLSPLLAIVAAVVYAYNHFGLFRTVVEAVGNFFTGVLIPALVLAATTVSTVLGAAFDWLSTNVFPTVMAVIDLVVIAFQRYIDIIEFLWPVFEMTFNNMMTILDAVWAFIQVFIDQVVNAWNLFGDNLLSAVMIVFNGIKNTVETILGVIRGVVQVITALIKGDWQGVWDGIKQIAQSIWDGILGLIDTAINAVLLVIETVLDAIHLIWDTIWGLIEAFVTEIWENILDLITNTFEAILGMIENTLGLVQDVWEDIWGAIQDFVEGVWNFIHDNVIEPTINAIESLIDTTLNAIQTVWETIWEAIQATFETVWDAIDTAVRTILGGIKAFIELEINGLKAIWDTVWNGIKSTFETVWNAMSSVVSTVTGAIGGAIQSVMGTISSAWGAWNTIKDTFIGVWDTIVEKFNDAIGLFKTAWNRFANFINGMHISIPGIDMPTPIPDIPGISFNMPNVIPVFDTGALVLEPTVAMLAASARAQPEIVSPVPLLRSIMREELAGSSGAGFLVENFNQTIEGVPPDRVSRETYLALRQIATDWEVA